MPGMWNDWVGFPDVIDSPLGLAGGLVRVQRQPEVPRPGKREREEMISNNEVLVQDLRGPPSHPTHLSLPNPQGHTGHCFFEHKASVPTDLCVSNTP